MDTFEFCCVMVAVIWASMMTLWVGLAIGQRNALTLQVESKSRELRWKEEECRRTELERNTAKNRLRELLGIARGYHARVSVLMREFPDFYSAKAHETHADIGETIEAMGEEL